MRATLSRSGLSRGVNRRRDDFERRLGEVTMFRACSKADLRRIARAGDAYRFVAGEVLVREGQRGNELFVLVEGEAEVTRGGRHLARLGPGDYFGELAVLEPVARNATVTATADGESLIIGCRELGALLADVPALTRKLLVGMARRLHEADERV